MTKFNPFLAMSLNIAAKAGSAAAEGLGRVPEPSAASAKKGGGCTPCAAMARRQAAHLAVAKMTGKR
jgi:hypothetical protein